MSGEYLTVGCFVKAECYRTGKRPVKFLKGVSREEFETLNRVWSEGTKGEYWWEILESVIVPEMSRGLLEVSGPHKPAEGGSTPPPATNSSHNRKHPHIRHCRTCGKKLPPKEEHRWASCEECMWGFKMDNKTICHYDPRRPFYFYRSEDPPNGYSAYDRRIKAGFSMLQSSEK